VKKLIVLGAGAIGATAVSLALGSGVAAADDYAGMSYSDASSAAGDAGQTVVIATRVGGGTDDDCVVTRSQTAPFIEGTDFVTHVSNTVQFYLNCNGKLASAGKPGNSLASPEGREEKAAEEQAAAEQAAQQELLDTNNAPGVPGG
jgi:beta-lactam-binding protein with PASTA domain